ncbi:CidA/LrgA family protein [Paenactinomyces guangxiensis]|uniref:CidA/LrgA family protein n=1 Tax=Paenactinomyces guangxiensis TaxID=1490290 RepID=A0A7W1WRW4_9BACL|nr:CidA/LrgA family protein [Paenactinomyces guangxiensis]MBA4494933.1 CidA/LrgA family protein [Paenactinomyces guangxiensis]MBH8592016.1 CidA/LrgA family protein [Paenactinomyces guangxiensis]
MGRMMMQFLTMLVIYLVGNNIATWLHLPFPGGIVGMTLLLSALLLGICKLTWVEIAAQWHIKHITLLFIPSIVGVLHYTDIFRSEGLKLAVVLAISSLAILLVTAYTAEYYENKKKRREQHGNINQ